MDYKKLKKRDSSLDILRIIAVFTVLSVHFFLHNGFYSQTIEGTPMYVAVVMRTLFSVCVPLSIRKIIGENGQGSTYIQDW